MTPLQRHCNRCAPLIPVLLFLCVSVVDSFCTFPILVNCERKTFISHTSTVATTTLFAAATAPAPKWLVYVDQSKSSLALGASATLDAFFGLCSSSFQPKENNNAPFVQVIPAEFKSKHKGPVVRCVSNTDSFEVSNVDSVDKVYRILTRHMKVPGISKNTCESLKWKYKGNGHLEAGQLEYAIEAYDKALAVVVPGQEGIVLLMRATAYQQRASKHREKLKEILDDLMALVPDTDSLLELFQATANQPELANAVFRKLLLDTNLQESKFRQTQYRHGLYQYALLQAAQDSLRATQLLPTYPESWRKAGEILSDLWKLKESAMYFERAMELDASLSRSIQPVIERLQKRQELIGNVRAYGWSEDALRLALDVVR